MAIKGRIPTVEEAARIQQTVEWSETHRARRRALRHPRRRRHSQVVETADPDFPAGTGGCDCGHCIQGVTIPGATICCTSHLSWDFMDPWTGEARVLNWIGGDQWATDAFSAETNEGCSNEYVWLMDLAAETLVLTIAVNNGCDQACARYEISDPQWECQCDIEFARKKYENVDVNDLSCYACLKPKPEEACSESLPIQSPVVITVAGYSGTFDDSLNGTCDCDTFNGSHALPVGLGGLFCSNKACCFTLLESKDFECTTPHPISPIDFVRYSVAFLPDGDEVTIAAQIQQDALGNVQHFNSTFLKSDVLAGGTFDLAYDPTIGEFTCAAPGTVSVTVNSTSVVTSDGSCSPCGEPDTAPIDAEGACCSGGECLDIDEATCGQISGVFYSTDIECETQCSALGTCCACVNDVITCVGSATSEQCAGLTGGGGVWTEAYGIACSPAEGGNDCGGSLGDPCTGDALGCCCVDGEKVGTMSEAACDALTGTWFTGQDCAATTCPVPATGACCEGGSCVGVTTEAACSGYWEEGSTCMEVSCEIAACCNCSTDGCDDIAESECTSRGAPWGWCGGSNLCSELPTCSFGCSGCL